MKKTPLNKLDFVDLITDSEHEQKPFIKQALKKTLLFTQVAILAMSLLVTYFVVKTSSSLPDISFIKSIEPEQSTRIYDINNELVAEVTADEDRVYVPLDKISPHFTRAVIAIEDMRFYEHSGVDLKGTIRAFVNNLTGASDIQGGSTITQQLAKNWYLVPEKSLKRKFLEAILASRIEHNFDKEKILEKYLNLIYLGNRSYGIERAAEKYFKKNAEDLDLAEASLIAAIIKAPELYSPYANFKEAKVRQEMVLDRMFQQGFITEGQREKALAKKIELQPQAIAFSDYQYFIDHVLYLLRERYGENVVKQGGLKVYTTLEPETQKLAEKAVVEGVKKIPRYCQVREGALVSIDVKTGYIKAIVGGVNYDKSQFNRATLAKRATGSGFKPIVYLTGLRLGIITPKTIVMDAPIAYRTKWNVWCPHNWDGRYYGPLTVRKALTLSRNTPTVRIALECGLDEVIETARLLGITSHMDRGYSIVLGSAGIAPIEVATAYTTLARDGIYLEPTAIRRVIDSKGNMLESNKREPMRVVESKYVRQLNSILVDVVQKGTGRNAILPGREIAGKTGTTDDFKDVWFTGFTPDTVTTIWMGNDENVSLRGIWSSNCATLWKNFSKKYYEKNTIIAERFKLPREILKEEKEENKEQIAKPPPRTYKPTQQAARKPNTYNRYYPRRYSRPQYSPRQYAQRQYPTQQQYAQRQYSQRRGAAAPVPSQKKNQDIYAQRRQQAQQRYQQRHSRQPYRQMPHPQYGQR